MRVSREEAAKNREKVLRTASRKFREHGYEGIGVVDLMEAAGLTHGGFYKSFEGKEALIVEATALALSATISKWREIVGDSDEPSKALARWYLHKEHLRRIEDGCTYAALASDAPRHSAELRRAFEESLEEAIFLLTKKSGGKKKADLRGGAIRSLALMIGTLVLARAVNRREFAHEIMESGQSG